MEIDREKEWTIMVYMAGDNNLSADMAYALEEIRDITRESGDKLNLMVYYDSSAPNVPTLYCDFTDYKKPVYQPSYKVEKTYRPARGRGRREIKTILADENSAAIYSILNFVDWCVNRAEWESAGEARRGRRAQNYALIFSGHSSAFQNMSFLVDASSNHYMTIPQLRWALEQITKKDPPFERNTRLLGQEIEILGFDSCVMGMLELGYEFRHFAKTMVASEGNIPSAGWTYGKILSGLLGSDKERTTDEIAAAFVKNFIEQQNKYVIGGVSVDLAAWDLPAVEAVATAADRLAASLRAALADESPANRSRLIAAMRICHLECQSYMLEQNIDLKDFCQLLYKEVKAIDPADETGIQVSCLEVIEKIDRCILMCGFSGSKYQYSNGISVFFPWTALSYNASRRNYEELSVILDQKLTNWNMLLREFVTGYTLRPARRQKTDQAAASADGNHLPPDGYYPAERNNQLADERNNLQQNERNNLQQNERNNQLTGEKGLYLLMSAQFKNIDAPWYISGFTTKLEQAADLPASNGDAAVIEKNAKRKLS